MSRLKILGQGGLFRQLVHVLRVGGGVGGLKASRVETATATVLKQLLPSQTVRSGTGGGGGGTLASDR